MYSFRELKKAKKLEIDGKEIKLVVIGNTATQFFSDAIEGYGKLEGLNLNLVDIDYNQIDAQLFDPTSESYEAKADYILLWLASDKLYEEFMDLPMAEKTSFAEDYMKRIEGWWNAISSKEGIRIIMPNLVEIDDKALGQYSSKIENTFIYQLRKLNFLLQEAMSKRPDVFPVDLAAIQNTIGRDNFYDPVLYYNAKMAIAINTLPYVAKAVIDVLKSAAGRIKKCVVLDLDNTLWGGVIGDDGIGGIEIGELGRGHVFTDFQKWLKELKDCGIILAVCSKNNEETAKEPFEKNEEMVLKLSDISVFVANWNDKASNIKLIRDTLNIGMDSMVFLDDNPFERNLVRELIPEITVPELPEDPALYLSFLQKENLFDTISFSKENSDRTKQYREEFERKKLQMSYESIDDYLKSLEMTGEAKSFEQEKFSRIAQLSQRSNQFNLRTVRYTEDEIARIAADDRYITLYFTLRDSFGDYGLVSVVILEKLNAKEAFVDTWFMSCRVLKRGMEDFIMNSVFRVAKEAGIETIKSEYIPTPKNKMVSNIYEEMGFAKISSEEEKNFLYMKEVNEYYPKHVWIEEK